jgi:hypothetical protein
MLRQTLNIRPLFRHGSAMSKASRLFRGLGNRSSTPSIETISLPSNLRRLRNQEHKTRKLIYTTLLVTGLTIYYLDGQYNAHALRRTIRAVYTGALLAADYKWNFTYFQDFLTIDLKKQTQSISYINVLQTESWI